jgi:hypothetical protein
MNNHCQTTISKPKSLSVGILWNDFPFSYSQFYEVIIVKGIYVIGEGKMLCVFVDIELHL